MALEDFAEILESAFAEWRKQQTKRRSSVSINSFAEYLGVSRAIVSYWMRDERTPNIDSVNQIIDKLEALLGPSVYDKLGLSRPDDQFGQLKTQYDLVPQAEKEKFLDEVRKLLIEHGWFKES